MFLLEKKNMQLIFTVKRNRFILFLAITCIIILCAFHGFYFLRTGEGKDILRVQYKVSKISSTKVTKCNNENKSLEGNKSIHVPMTLVLGYMRSGSSLTADIIRCNHGDFYIFEPLHGLIELSIKQNSPVRFLNGTRIRIAQDDKNINNMMADMLYNWFTCDFRQIDLLSLSNEFIHIYTPEHDTYFNCLQGLRKKSALIRTIHKCLHILEERCKIAKSRIYKTIRLPLASVRKLLERLPSLKVVHLMRDPRAILQSQLVEGLANTIKFSNISNLTCRQMHNDVIDMKSLVVKYPGRIQRLVYENLAVHPIEVSKKLYNFLNARFDRNVEGFVNYLTTGPVSKCNYCTNRGNSSYNAFKWMETIRPMYHRIVDQHCREIYREIGYRQLSFNDLKSRKNTWNPNAYQRSVSL